jgi:hypothetical protein
MQTRTAPRTKTLVPKVRNSDSIFNEKFKILQKEYGVDMNEANDVEGLRNLVRLQMQLENVTQDIDQINMKPTRALSDYDSLKKLGEFQRQTMTSINDIGTQLGISRKQRREKQADDIPQFIDKTLRKAQTFFDRATIKIECPKCMIELGRYWLNFPRENNDIQMSLPCWKCKETVEHIG